MASPVRTDEQIVPRNRWVPIGKSNCYLNEEKSQPNPIFKIAVDILKQTNFFRAFTASSTIPAIYIQQFWDTIRFDSKAGSYKCQLDEQWFNLTQDTLRDALQITPVDNNRAFSSPPTPDTLVEFVNKLGYPKEVMHLSNVTTNDMFQPWRALATIINLCLTGKTSGFERPRAPPAKPTKQAKPKATEQSTVSKSKAKKSKPAPAKPKEKKRKPMSESSEAQPLAKRAKAGKSHEDTEAILQKVLEESLTDAYPTQRGPLPPVVIRETDAGKVQPLPEVPGKGKEKVGEEQVAQVLLHLQTTKKKSPTEQYIFQRHTPISYESAGQESSSLYAERGVSGSDTESDEEIPSVIRSGAQDEGQAGPDPGTLDEGQAGPNPDDINTTESLPLPTPCVLAGPNLEHSES
ncbi:hypothetical protein Tco_0947173 [Tanacetum coccineum]